MNPFGQRNKRQQRGRAGHARGKIINTLTLDPVNDQVVRVHDSRGDCVGHLKRIGAMWKFKAIGYDASGAVVPGGGPLTDRHNTRFAVLDVAVVSATLSGF